MSRIILFCLLLTCEVLSAEYQWSVQLPGVTSAETHGPPRAFLWIPPTCERVRAVVIAQHNMLEIPVLEHAEFRKAVAELNFAIVWITPPIGGAAKFDAEEAEHFEAMLRALADASGYGEIANVPLVPVGHSAMAEFPYLFAAQMPQRTLAALSLKGSWPEKQPWVERFAASGVPLLFISGEYEWADERAGKTLTFRRAFPAAPLSMIADAGGGHFDFHESLIRFMADYIRAAARCRLGETLRVIDTSKQGWLVDRWRIDKTPRAAAAPVAKFKGDLRETYWCFDEEHARATERMQAAYAGKQPQLLGYQQNGKVVDQVNGTHAQVSLNWLPDPAGDGITFKLAGVFLDAAPAGRPERWAKLKAGSAIEHPGSSDRILITPICGPVEKLSTDTFALRFDRIGFDNAQRSAEIWFQAEHPGDAHFKRAVQQAVLHFPLRNNQGKAQSIEFDAIGADLKLRARSSADAKVRFYVREGPAEVVGDELRLTAIPPRAKRPMTATVISWQWGSSMEPKLQTAEPVSQTFRISR